MAKTKAVLKALATNRATYRFLAAVLLAAGVTAGSQWVVLVETLVCSLVSECHLRRNGNIQRKQYLRSVHS